MKFKRLAGAAVAVCLMLNICAVSAEKHTINYVKSIEGDSVKVTGTVSGGNNKNILLRIDYADSVLNGNTTALQNKVAYQKQSKTDANGNFEFSLKLTNGKSYVLRLGVGGDDEDTQETFTFYGSDYRNTALAEIKTEQSAGNIAGLAGKISAYYPNLYLETPIFNNYFNTHTDLTEIAGILVIYPEISSLDILTEQLESSVIVNELRKTVNYGGMETVIGTYDTALGLLSSSIYTTYSNMSEQTKKKVYESFVSKKPASIQEIKDGFALSVLNSYFADAIGAQSVKKILSDNSALLGINLSDYTLLDSQYLQFIGVSFTSLGGIKTKLSALNDENTPETDTGEGGGAGGGAGGGGGGGGSSVSSITTGGETFVVPPVATDLPAVDNTGHISGMVPFRDMGNYAWANDAVSYLYEKGVVHGYSEDEFVPEALVTREQFLKLLVSGFEISAETNDDATFTDVSSGEWYYPFIKVGINSGIISGIGDNLFGVGSTITRQDLVVMIYRAIMSKYGTVDTNGTSTFEDFESISDYAKNAVMFAESNDIVRGMGDGKFHSRDSATRAESAVILYRAIEYMKARGGM